MSEEGRYVADGRNAPGGEGELTVGNSRIDFDGAATMGADLPGPADLLAAALAACILKNVERFSGMLPFEYAGATVHVEFDSRGTAAADRAGSLRPHAQD